MGLLAIDTRKNLRHEKAEGSNSINLVRVTGFEPATSSSRSTVSESPKLRTERELSPWMCAWNVRDLDPVVTQLVTQPLLCHGGLRSGGAGRGAFMDCSEV
jgi:hypothetical protein